MLQIEPRPLIMSVPPTSTQTVELKPSLHYTGLLYLVGRSPTLAKNGGLGDIPIPGFVPLQEFCSPIRLQHLSVQCKQCILNKNPRSRELIPLSRNQIKYLWPPCIEVEHISPC